MSDLTASQWKAVEDAAFMIGGDRGSMRVIGIGELRNIIRKSRRTTEQNRLIWQLYTDILMLGGEALGGWTKDDIHEYLLGEWSGWIVCEAFGQKRKKPKLRSSRLTKSQFTDYIEFICQRMAEHGIVLTLPGDPMENRE